MPKYICTNQYPMSKVSILTILTPFLPLFAKLLGHETERSPSWWFLSGPVLLRGIQVPSIDPAYIVFYSNTYNYGSPDILGVSSAATRNEYPNSSKAVNLYPLARYYLIFFPTDNKSRIMYDPTIDHNFRISSLNLILETKRKQTISILCFNMRGK